MLEKLVISRRSSEEREAGFIGNLELKMGARTKWEEGGRETFLCKNKRRDWKREKTGGRKREVDNF